MPFLLYKNYKQNKLQKTDTYDIFDYFCVQINKQRQGIKKDTGLKLNSNKKNPQF